MFKCTLLLALCCSCISWGIANASRAKHAKKNAKPSAPVKADQQPASPRRIKLQRPSLLDFLVGPDDFVRDVNVNYLIRKLHHPEVIEKFYLSAQEIYRELPLMYREMQGSHEISTKFMDFMEGLKDASFKMPLTTTNLIFAMGKHILPLFKRQPQPLVDIAEDLAFLEESDVLTGLMSFFFIHYTVREVDQIQDLIICACLAQVRDPTDEKSKALIAKYGHLDIAPTSLKNYSEKIRITLANCFSKIVILLDLFLTDLSAASRGYTLVNTLWGLHTSRLAKQAGVAIKDLDPYVMDPRYYRKLAINFSFEDWNPDRITPKTMKELRKAVIESQKAQDALVAAQERKELIKTIKTYSMILAGPLALLLIFAIVMIRKRRLQLDQIDLDSLDYKTSDIVGHLENSIKT